MFYEEKLIDGVLHWRQTPDGPWAPLTSGQLTDRLIQEQDTSRRYRLQVEKMRNAIDIAARTLSTVS